MPKIAPPPLPKAFVGQPAATAAVQFGGSAARSASAASPVAGQAAASPATSQIQNLASLFRQSQSTQKTGIIEAIKSGFGLIASRSAKSGGGGSPTSQTMNRLAKPATPVRKAIVGVKRLMSGRLPTAPSVANSTPAGTGVTNRARAMLAGQLGGIQATPAAQIQATPPAGTASRRRAPTLASMMQPGTAGATAQPPTLQAPQAKPSVFRRRLSVGMRRAMALQNPFSAPVAKSSQPAGYGVQRRRSGVKTPQPAAPPPTPRANIAQVQRPGNLLAMMGQPNAVQAAIAQQQGLRQPPPQPAKPMTRRQRLVARGRQVVGGAVSRISKRAGIKSGVNLGAAIAGGAAGGAGGAAAAAGSAGGAGAAAGGGAAAAGGIGAAASGVALLGVASIATVKAIKLWSDHLLQSKEGLRKYSGQIDQSFATLEMRKIGNQINKAQMTSGSTSKLAELSGDLSEAMSPLEATFSTLGTTIVIPLVKIATAMAKGVDSLSELVGLKAIAEILEKHFDKEKKLDHAREFADDIRNGRNGPRPPLPPLP